MRVPKAAMRQAAMRTDGFEMKLNFELSGTAKNILKTRKPERSKLISEEFVVYAVLCAKKTGLNTARYIQAW